MIELKPCPFCGGDWGLFKVNTPKSVVKYNYFVECCDCGARTGLEVRGNNGGDAVE